MGHGGPIILKSDFSSPDDVGHPRPISIRLVRFAPRPSAGRGWSWVDHSIPPFLSQTESLGGRWTMMGFFSTLNTNSTLNNNRSSPPLPRPFFLGQSAWVGVNRGVDSFLHPSPLPSRSSWSASGFRDFSAWPFPSVYAGLFCLTPPPPPLSLSPSLFSLSLNGPLRTSKSQIIIWYVTWRSWHVTKHVTSDVDDMTWGDYRSVWTSGASRTAWYQTLNLIREHIVLPNTASA